MVAARLATYLLAAPLMTRLVMVTARLATYLLAAPLNMV